MSPLEPVTLQGASVRLEPLTPGHAGALWSVARDPELWTWNPSIIEARADFDRYLDVAFAAQTAGTALPFVIVANDEVAGSTRLGNAVPEHDRIEIGWTFVGRRWQRTAVNTEAKRLLLRHAFETLGARRVEFETDARNAVSRAAIARLGATEEGTLRQHTVRQHGDVRDTVYFSLLAHEWPAAEALRQARLGEGP